MLVNQGLVKTGERATKTLKPSAHVPLVIPVCSVTKVKFLFLNIFWLQVYFHCKLPNVINFDRFLFFNK